MLSPLNPAGRPGTGFAKNLLPHGVLAAHNLAIIMERNGLKKWMQPGGATFTSASGNAVELRFVLSEPAVPYNQE